MPTILPLAKTTFQGPNGEVLSGGSVAFSIPGTTTPKNTYQDLGQTILNTNPVVLDANGQAIIWGTGQYRQQVYDANGNLIWDQITEDTSAGLLGNMTDNPYIAATGGFTPGTTTQLTLAAGPGSAANMWVYFDGVYQAPDTWSVSGTTVTFNAAIPVGTQEVNIKVGSTVAIGTPGVGTITDINVATNAAINASKLSFLQSGAGAVTRTVLSKLQDVFNVKDFGATGNGTTDDTAAIQSAENALSAAGGGKLYFPAGTYSIGSAGIQKATNVDWMGAEFGVTIIKAQAVTYSNGLVYGTGLSGFVISDITFDWSLATYTLIGTINFNTCSDYVIERCSFLGTFAFAISHNGGNRFIIRDNTFYRTNAGGGAQCQSIEISTGSATCQWGIIQNNYMYLAGMNFSGQNCLIDNNKVYNWQFGGGITTEQNNNCSELTITNNTCIGGNGEDVNATICLGIENWAPRSLIANNHCEANSGDGISNGGQNCVVANNHCINNGQMNGNGITSRYTSGSVNGNYSTYIGNECVDTQSTHTQLYGYADYNSSVFGNFVVGNTFENNLTAPMNIQGTTAVCTPSFQSQVGLAGATITNASSQGGTFACNGAVLGDLVTVSLNQDIQGVKLWGWVSATNTVKWRMENNTGASVTLATGTLTAACTKAINYPTY